MRFFVSLFCVLSVFARAAENPADKPVPVTSEPMHRPVFENDAVRIIDVQIPPGKITLYHMHKIPSVVVYLTKSTNKSQTWGETDPAKFLDRAISPGESRYAPYDEQPLTHRVTNTGKDLFRVFDIELLHKKPAAAPSYAKLPAEAKTQWEEKLARMAKVTLEPGKSVDVAASDHSYLVIGITGATNAGSKTLKWADYSFVAPKNAIHLANAGTEKSEAFLLELN